MSSSIKGPALFLAQFISDEAPFNTLPSIAKWAAGLGYKGVQVPTWDKRIFDLDRAASSKAYCDEVKGICAKHGLTITELSCHLQSQLVAVHPAYDTAFDAFAPEHLHGNPDARQAWAVDQVTKVAKASQHLGLKGAVGFTGSLAFPYLYPWPQRPAGLIDEAVRGARAPLEAAFGYLRRRRASISGSRSTPAKTCSTASTFRALPRSTSTATRAARSLMIHRTSCSSKWIIWRSSTSTMTASAPFTSRTRNSIRRGAKASIRATPTGPTARAASAPLGDGQVDFRRYLLEAHAIRV